MKKADYIFHRDKKHQLENDARQSPERGYFWWDQNNRPIFIPKRKKKK